LIKHYAIALIVAAVLTGVVSISLARADASYTIDFEGLAKGAIVAELSCGSGITCPDGSLGGAVSVRAHNAAIDSGNTNTAMIFNSDCIAFVDCTGEDDDLSFPGHGNTLINSEDLDQSDPDDQINPGAFMEFDFSEFGPGEASVHSIAVGDIEEREIGAYLLGADGPCTGTDIGENGVPLPITGNNVINNVEFELTEVRCLLVHLNGSGAIDNIRFTTNDPPAPDIDIEKATNGEDADNATGPVVPVGSQVDFTYLVTNTGNVDLSNVTVRDDLVSLPATGSAAATIDFEGLAEGAIVGELSCGAGITCPDGHIDGIVVVQGHNPAIDNGNTNTAMIFNSDCVISVDCTGGDDDLSFPGHGDTLINSADLDQTDPDDQVNPGSFMEFDFSEFGPGGVVVHSIDVGDIELRVPGAFLESTGGPCIGIEVGLDVIPLPVTGNNVNDTVVLELMGVHCMHVHLNGSGNIDNIMLTTADQPAPDVVEVTCPQDTLAVGETMTCTGSTVATPGQYTNLGTACGDGAGQNVCDDDFSNHLGADTVIAIEQQTDGKGADYVSQRMV